MSTGWRDVVERFGMAAHPEGGWYVETWRADPPPGGTARPVASAILFLLPAGEASHWHRVDADELWQYSAGDPLELRIAPADGGPVATTSAWPGRHGRRQGPGRRAGRRMAGGASTRGVDARGLRRGSGFLVRWVRTGSGGLGTARLTIPDRVLNRTTLLRQSLLERASDNVAPAIGRLAGIQAQHAEASHVALWSRVTGFESSKLERALERQYRRQGDRHPLDARSRRRRSLPGVRCRVIRGAGECLERPDPPFRRRRRRDPPEAPRIRQGVANGG